MMIFNIYIKFYGYVEHDLQTHSQVVVGDLNNKHGMTQVQITGILLQKPSRVLFIASVVPLSCLRGIPTMDYDHLQYIR